VVIRNLIKLGAYVHARCFATEPADGVSVLMYHRVVGDLPLELDLPFEIFRLQMEWLSRSGVVIPYPDAVRQLVEGPASRGMRFVITFDDAYEDFHRLAYPVLREYGLPATLFVPTRFIDEPTYSPLSRQVAGMATKIRPMSWAQLRDVADDPLVTIGSHTHSHSDLVSLSEESITAEMSIASDRFRSELGFVPKHFAYPRGIWDARVLKAISPLCESACTTSGHIATSSNAPRYAIPRVPVRRSDGWMWFVERIYGRLNGEERIVRLAKRALGRNVGY